MQPEVKQALNALKKAKLDLFLQEIFKDKNCYIPKVEDFEYNSNNLKYNASVPGKNFVTVRVDEEAMNFIHHFGYGYIPYLKAPAELRIIAEVISNHANKLKEYFEDYFNQGIK